MGFREYLSGLEQLSIKVTPLRTDRSCFPGVLVPASESTELRDSDLSEGEKRVIYSGAKTSYSSH